MIENDDAGDGAVRALQGVSTRVGNGETAALLGTNGNGKSTVMKCVMGMVRPARGTLALSIDGVQHELTQLSTEDIVNLGVALVPEGRRLFPRLTVEENLLLGAFRPQARKNIAKISPSAMKRFRCCKSATANWQARCPAGNSKHAPSRALASSPKLLLVDEPSVGLAPILVSQTITKINELKERYGLTLLMTEQNFHLATRIADRGCIIVHGEIVFEGAVAEPEQNDLVKNYYLGTAA